MCATTYFGDKLVEAVRAGQVDESCIDEAAVRIVRTLLAFQAAREQAPEQPGEDPAALALEAACKGITLLKNRDVLPFDSTRARTLAVIGRLAAQPNLGDHGSSRVYPPYAITPLEGLARTVPEVELLYADGSDPTAAE